MSVASNPFLNEEVQDSKFIRNLNRALEPDGQDSFWFIEDEKRYVSASSLQRDTESVEVRLAKWQWDILIGKS